MKKTLVLIILTISIFIFTGCASAPVTAPDAPAPKKIEKINPATIDFGQYWTGTIRMKEKSKSDMGSDAEARFYSEWTMGEDAGNVYPKSFTGSNTGNEVKMDFRWDNGGDIPAGIYDVIVDIDGMPGTGTVKNLKLDKGTSYKVYISFNAAKIDINFETDGDDLFVYPAGTHDKYETLGRLDNIPEELLINHINSYTEGNAIWWLIPAGIPLDILRTYSNGDSKWFKDYTAKPESFIKDLK